MFFSKAIRWSKRLSVRNPHLDEDHKYLVKILNRVVKAVDKNHGAHAINHAFDDLFWYTRYHFAREEAVMEECGYPGLEEHKAVHEEMKRKLQRYFDNHLKDPGPASAEALRDFLCDWLFKHISETDTAYTASIRGKEARIHTLLRDVNPYPHD